ncbi:MAG: hypothetical protein IT427_09540 [Pirellulales bacterium]|nr:hypothetical protein [Pirellulales bacterium]
MPHSLLIAIVFVAGSMAVGVGRIVAQVPVAVQLPTFHYFSVDTTVLVPDRGAAYLGGVNYSSTGRTSRGLPGLGRPFANTAISRSTVGGGMWVSAYIHDLEAMDAALLGQGDFVAGQSVRRPATSAVAATKTDPTFANSIAAIRAQATSDEQANQLEAEANLKRGHEKLKEGKSGVAKIYFQIAERRGTGIVKEQARAGLKSIERGTVKRAVAKK